MAENEDEDDHTEDVQDFEGKEDTWRRQHNRDRQTLFTPCGTKGLPARPSKLSGRRATEGKSTTTCEDVIIVDGCKNHKKADRRLEGRQT